MFCAVPSSMLPFLTMYIYMYYIYILCILCIYIYIYKHHVYHDSSSEL